uniref:Uncharacterized protein n=1 Tax=Faecalibaculum rodentium TaxID=1702221 RepID=A0A140DTX0_9FIRM|nr:hypothetical protein AALO17_09630 [Faecalibaculum rodentium]
MDIRYRRRPSLTDIPPFMKKSRPGKGRHESRYHLASPVPARSPSL